MEYKVVAGREAEILEQKLKEFFRQGWSLQGGVAVTFVAIPGLDPYLLFSQAIVKTATDGEEAETVKGD